MTAAHRNRSFSPALAAFCAALVVTSILPVAVFRSGARSAYVDDTVARATDRISVIVQGFPGSDRSVSDAITRAGGTVTDVLPIVDGFAATVPAASIGSLAKLSIVRGISLDRSVRLLETAPGDASALASAYPRVVGATDLWSAGYTGQGVTVAIVDTGVDQVPDLAGRVLSVFDDPSAHTSACEDLSGEHGCTDTYGHGTFLAGIIAGNGASSGGVWKGVAPSANILSIKIAGADGSSDVSNILAAIQWIVSFKDRYGIRVLNLSLGTDATGTYLTDPLNYAVERAWMAGIVVVVSASNQGPNPGTISKPADDPYVITVGAIDDRGTADVGDDELPAFSARGPTAADGLTKPDVVAPGAHLTSLRAVGSSIDSLFPSYVDGAYRTGSGTSMSAAVVSGTVALMLQADPAMTPDRVKFALTATARPAASVDPMAVGAGVIDGYTAALAAPPGLANQGLVPSTGINGIGSSRGHMKVVDSASHTVVTGAETLQNPHWDGLDYRVGPWDHASWYSSSWYGSSWYGSSWYGSNWYGSNWYGSSWYGLLNGSSWYGSSWYGSSWYGVWE
jgi:serine protease AprX